MHKQDNTTTDKGLEAIMESMYTEKTIPCDKCNGEGCEHCNGTGTHAVKEDEDTGRIPHDVDSFGTGDSDIDHHNQYMMDRDLLNPLHKAAQAVGADDINDWMIKQIKDQGDTWIEWFIDTVIGGDEEY